MPCLGPKEKGEKKVAETAERAERAPLSETRKIALLSYGS